MTFFSVDPEAGFAAVARHQLGGSWQVPAEAVRFAAAYGASSVEVEVHRRAIDISASGSRVPRSLLETAAAAMGHGDGVNRLKALGDLEDREATVLAWAAGMGPASLEVQTRGSEGSAVLSRSRDGEIRFRNLAEGGKDGFRLCLTGGSIDQKRICQWLRTACRFSRIPVFLNGTDLRRGLGSGSFRARLKQPLPADVALGVDRENPRLWLLRHGIVETRVTVPGWPPFEAAVELAGEVGGWASSADLRRVLTPHLPALVSSVVDLLLRVVPRLDQLGRERRQGILRALLVAAAAGIRRTDICRVPMIDLEGGDSGRRLSLDDLKRWSGPLPKVCDPVAVEAESTEPSLVLGTRERDLAGEILGRPLESKALLRRSRMLSVRKAVEWFSGLIGGLTAPRAEPVGRLTERERHLASALEKRLEVDGGPVEVRLVRGRGEVRQLRRVLFLPRENTAVVHAVEALQRNRSDLYAIALALAPPTWRIASVERERWLGRWRPSRGGD